MLKRSGADRRVALLGMIVLALGVVGLVSPAPRIIQLWPDVATGVTSGLLEGMPACADPQMLPFGVHRTGAGDVVRARTYLHFPLDVFPPGTEILRATLYVHVDGASNAEEATFGAYRVLEPWGEQGWSNDPAIWPALLTAPIAETWARFDVVTPTLWVSTPTITPTLVPTLTLTPTTTPIPTTTFTPTTTPTTTATFTPTATPTTTLTPTPPTSPLPTPTPFVSPTVPVMALQQTVETWLTWDITALMRAWQARDVPNDGLALAPAPDPNADPGTVGDLLVARWLSTDDPVTRPYLIIEFEVHPVTPTPTAVPVPVLPPAGGPVGWWGAGLLLVGVALLALGLVMWCRQGAR